MEAAGIDAEWANIRSDLKALPQTEIEQDRKRFLAAILRSAGARLPRSLRQVNPAEQEALHATAGICCMQHICSYVAVSFMLRKLEYVWLGSSIVRISAT